MILEKIEIEFTKEIESLIDQKRQQIYKLSGLEKVNAKIKHLDDLKYFADQMNTIINEIIQKHSEGFQSEDEFNKFTNYIKPTFEKLHLKYVELGTPS
jgi:chemotaxis methyl-accepting protein methylase